MVIIKQLGKSKQAGGVKPVNMMISGSFSAGKLPQQPIVLIFLILSLTVPAQGQRYLKRSLDDIHEQKSDFSTSSAHYYPLFGTGDNGSGIIRGIERYGRLIVDSGGVSNLVSLPGEEAILYILQGTGTFQYGRDNLPVSGEDFIYLPAGLKFRFTNPRERPLSVLIMGFRAEPGSKIKPSAEMMIANAGDVPFQVLGSHGPTTTFRLLLGTTLSTRDRLAAACQVTSLFVMDFAAGGTNIPHRHKDEEEIYFILRGRGDIVAGEEADGGELRHISKEGDAFFFSPNTLIGFYSANKPEEEHARILAVRFTYPAIP